jgi:hypothetical protein
MELPPVPAIRAIVERYARLIVKLGEEFGERPLVLPTSRYFPDDFGTDQKSLKRLVGRMKRHAGMSDIPTKTRLVAIEGGSAGAGCDTGSCGTSSCAPTASDVERLVDEGETWRLQVPEPELKHPVVLTTNLARVLSYVFLAETMPEGEPLESPADVTADLTAVALGFGVLMLQGSYIYSKSCGGPSIAKVTKLGPGELAIATALFARVGDHPVKIAQRQLDPTQSALLGEARSWLSSNEALIEGMRTHPQRIAQGKFQLSETQPWLTRVFGGKKRSAAEAAFLSEEGLTDESLGELEDLLATLPTQTSSSRVRDRDPEHDELSDLVASALADSRAEG